MADMKLEVLKKLEAGEISAQDALAMLGQEQGRKTEAEAPRADTYEHENRENRQRTSHERREVPPNTAEGGVSGLFNWVGGFIEDIVGGVHDLDIPGNISDIMEGTYGHYKGTETFESGHLAQGITGLSVVGKNAKVEVHGYDGNTLRFNCAYDARRSDPEIYLHEENGRYQLVYDEKLMRYVSIVCEVPNIFIEELQVASKNDKVFVWGGLNAGTVLLSTKNAAIKAEDIHCKEFVAQSRNDAVRAAGITAESVHIETSNAKITAEDISSRTAMFKTTNDRISTSGLNVSHVKMTTTNSGIKLEKAFQDYDSDGWEGERTLEALTTNGGISLLVPQEIGLNIKAHTTNSKITCARDNMNLSEFSRGHIAGESHDYSYNSMKMRVALATTNSSIKIRG